MNPKTIYWLVIPNLGNHSTLVFCFFYAACWRHISPPLSIEVALLPRLSIPWRVVPDTYRLRQPDILRQPVVTKTLAPRLTEYPKLSPDKNLFFRWKNTGENRYGWRLVTFDRKKSLNCPIISGNLLSNSRSKDSFLSLLSSNINR